jgi:hypothetical protein
MHFSKPSRKLTTFAVSNNLKIKHAQKRPILYFEKTNILFLHIFLKGKQKSSQFNSTTNGRESSGPLKAHLQKSSIYTHTPYQATYH